MIILDQPTYLLKTIKADILQGPVGNGCTEPYHMLCSGDPYIVKFAQNPESSRVLINEYVCALLAKKLDLPIPDASLIEINETLIQQTPILQEIGVKPGLHFGSKKMRKATPIPSHFVIKRAVNKEYLPDILLFDHWINNKDRGSNSGNMLIETNTKEIVIIDHTHAFDIGSLWNEHQLRRLIGEPLIAFDLTGPVYSNFVNYINGHNPFHSVLHKMSNITEDYIKGIICSTPEEWGCTQTEQKVLCEYILDRKERIEEVLPKLQEVLPYWKGGANSA